MFTPGEPGIFGEGDDTQHSVGSALKRRHDGRNGMSSSGEATSAPEFESGRLRGVRRRGVLEYLCGPYASPLIGAAASQFTQVRTQNLVPTNTPAAALSMNCRRLTAAQRN